MNKTSKITFWIFLFWKFTALLSQESELPDPESEPPDFLQLIDGRPLILNDSYCLEQITVTTVSEGAVGYHNGSSYYFKITWDSKSLMTSIKVESDSLNDSYCEAENKHYYYRKPLNRTAHVFPDEVHEGIRFLPIRLDCRYIITPEVEGACRILKLRYSTPGGGELFNHSEQTLVFLLDFLPLKKLTLCQKNCIGKKCTCRNVNMSGPELRGEIEKDGVNVFWVFPRDTQRNVSMVAISVYSEDGINIKELAKRKTPVTSLETDLGGKQFFKMNVTLETLYRIQGYFENDIHCRGNSTFLLLRHVGKRAEGHNETVIVYTMALVLLLLLTFLGIFYFWKTQVRRICVKLFPSADSADVHAPSKEIRLPQMVWNSSYVEDSRDSYHFDYRDLVKLKEIASGNFGIVYLAYSPVSLRGCNEFAIKQIKDKAGTEGVADFMEEIEMFKLVGDHPNVVKMFGFCSAPQPLTIIMEYVPYNLLVYLKSLRAEFERKKLDLGDSVSYAQLSHSRASSSSLSDDNYISQNEVECLPLNGEYKNRELEYVLDNRELEIFGLQIARGMAHLESRNIVHRDLAARNVLMDHGKILKISDFGMSKTGIYVNKRSKKFPLRWMSPEALVRRVYSNKSDVWSFGVVLWEIGTLGAFPYPNLQNEEVISLLEKGGHLDKPENVTNQLYSLMVDCWALSPDDRPNFKELVDKIESFCEKSNGYVEFENLESNYVFPPMEEDIEKK